MNVLAIEQRLVAMHTHLPAFKIKHGVLGSAGYEKFKTSLKALQGYKAPFWVVDGNLTATVEDVVMLARQLKPDCDLDRRRRTCCSTRRPRTAMPGSPRTAT